MRHKVFGRGKITEKVIQQYTLVFHGPGKFGTKYEINLTPGAKP